MNGYLTQAMQPNTTVATDRELEVLARVADGLSNAEIGLALGIKEQTVKTHVKHILTKLGARNRAHAVAMTIRKGLI